VRILVLGAGVIGSVYASKLLSAGHDVVLLARGPRLADLRLHGLIVADAESGRRTAQPVTVVSDPAQEDHFDLVLVPVRAEQLAGTLPVLTGMKDGSDVLFFGNTGNRVSELATALGERALFGFPAVGGTRSGATINCVLVKQQKTMLGELDGTTTPRIRRLQHLFNGSDFPTLISADIGGWLLGHAAFVVPIAFALYRVGIDGPRLAADPATMRLMVLGTREAFTALHAAGNQEIPTNLRALYRLPTVLVTAYWRRVLNGPKGELRFGAHSRAAPEEMHALARTLQGSLRQTGRPTPHLERLLGTSCGPARAGRPHDPMTAREALAYGAGNSGQLGTGGVGVAANRDRAADSRDVAADVRDDVADVRDRMADSRDATADDRDADSGAQELDIEQLLAHALRRDSDAERRDRAAKQRDEQAETRHSTGQHADNASPGVPAAHKAWIDRILAGEDRDAAAGDRAALILERRQAVRRRDAASEQRQSGALDRMESEGDRVGASKDRADAADDRRRAHVERHARATTT